MHFHKSGLLPRFRGLALVCLVTSSAALGLAGCSKTKPFFHSTEETTPSKQTAAGTPSAPGDASANPTAPQPAPFVADQVKAATATLNQSQDYAITSTDLNALQDSGVMTAEDLAVLSVLVQK